MPINVSYKWNVSHKFFLFKNYKQTEDKTLFTGVSHLANFSCTPTPFYENALRQMAHSRFSSIDSPFSALHQHHTQKTTGIYISILHNPLNGDYNFKTHISLEIIHTCVDTTVRSLSHLSKNRYNLATNPIQCVINQNTSLFH